jgi:bicarbonate transport system substrate-binding protein
VTWKPIAGEWPKILSSASYFNVPVAIVEPMLLGTYIMGDNQPEIKDFQKAAMYWKSPRVAFLFPDKSLDSGS